MSKPTPQAANLAHLTQEIEHLRWIIDSLTKRNEILEKLNATREESLSLYRQLSHKHSTPKDADPEPEWTKNIEGVPQ